MPRSGKNKTITLKEKVEILEKLDKGATIYRLAKQYGIGRATIFDIRKKKEQILDHVKSMESGPGKRRTIKVGKCPRMENALSKWFDEMRSKLIIVTGETLKEKALEIYKEITNKDDFRASDGWLDRFKRRFGIRLSYISSEMLESCDSSSCSSEEEEDEEEVEEEVRETEEIEEERGIKEVGRSSYFDDEKILREIKEVEEQRKMEEVGRSSYLDDEEILREIEKIEVEEERKMEEIGRSTYFDDEEIIREIEEIEVEEERRIEEVRRSSYFDDEEVIRKIEDIEEIIIPDLLYDRF